MSTDDQQTAERFRASLDLPFPLVGDPEAKVTRAWGASWPIFKVARRVTYIVGKDRRIAQVHSSELDAASHVACALPA